MQNPDMPKSSARLDVVVFTICSTLLCGDPAYDSPEPMQRPSRTSRLSAL